MPRAGADATMDDEARIRNLHGGQGPWGAGARRRAKQATRRGPPGALMQVRALPVSPRPRLQVEELPRPPHALSMTPPGERVVEEHADLLGIDHSQIGECGEPAHCLTSGG